jgi:hypothetical protein
VSDPNTEARELVAEARREAYLLAPHAERLILNLAAALEQAGRALERKDAALQALAALADEFDGEGFASVEQRFAWAMQRVREAAAAHG